MKAPKRPNGNFLVWLHRERARLEKKRIRRRVTLREWQEESLRHAEQIGLRVIRLPSPSLSR
jgi:hypothetical protein